MNVGISRAVLEQILAAAAATPREEVCGLLLGQPGRIDAVCPAANIAADRARRFELDPAVLIAAHKAARGGGPAVIGHYHSHPGGQAMPSAHDAELARDGQLWLIVAKGEARLFEAVAGGVIHGRFRAVGLDVSGGVLA